MVMHTGVNENISQNDLYTILYTLSTKKEKMISQYFEQMFCWIIINRANY